MLKLFVFFGRVTAPDYYFAIIVLYEKKINF